jgi:hypothetical protein
MDDGFRHDRQEMPSAVLSALNGQKVDTAKGIKSRLRLMRAFLEILSATGIKMAMAAVELMKAPVPAMASIKKAMILASFPWPALNTAPPIF